MGLVTYFFFPLSYAYAATVLAAFVFFYFVHLREVRMDEHGVSFRVPPRFDEHKIDWAHIDHSVVFVGKTGIFREIAIFTNDAAFPPDRVWRIGLGFLDEERIRDLLSVSELRINETVDEVTYIQRLRNS